MMENSGKRKSEDLLGVRNPAYSGSLLLCVNTAVAFNVAVFFFSKPFVSSFYMLVDVILRCVGI